MRYRRAARKPHPTRRGSRAVAIVVALATVVVLTPVARATSEQRAAAPCGFTTNGANWSFKGQKGTTYTVVALGGASCTTAHIWLPRLTREPAAFTLSRVPTGWHCSTTGGVTTGLTKSGQCTTRAGGIVEWIPKLRT